MGSPPKKNLASHEMIDMIERSISLSYRSSCPHYHPTPSNRPRHPHYNLFLILFTVHVASTRWSNHYIDSGCYSCLTEATKRRKAITKQMRIYKVLLPPSSVAPTPAPPTSAFLALRRSERWRVKTAQRRPFHVSDSTVRCVHSASELDPIGQPSGSGSGSATQ